MALVRCRAHGPPDGRTHVYVAGVEPAAPDVLRCGLEDCDDPGVIWLDRGGERRYEDGARIFGVFNGYTVKFAAGNTVVWRNTD